MEDLLKQILSELKELRIDVNGLKTDVKDLRADVEVLKADFKALKNDVEVLKADVKALKTDVEVLKNDVEGLKQDVQSLDKKIDDVRAELLKEIAILEGKVDENERKAEKRHEEMKAMKIDIDYLIQKSGQHDADINKLKTLFFAQS